MAASDKILEVKGISKNYVLQSTGGLIKALSNISFSLSKGDSLGIIGQNGSGKSTLLKVLSGILKPDAGTVDIFGSFASILDLGFGMVPEFSGRENIYLVGSLSGYNKSYMRTIIDEIIDFAAIEAFIDQPVKTYSNGMYLRLAFAIKAILQVDLLILDEVMAVGDIKFQEKCKLKFQQLLNQGTSLIIVSHNLKDIAEFTTRGIILEKGMLVADDATMKVINGYEALSGFKKLKDDVAINHATDVNNCITVMDYWLSSHIIKMEEAISISIKFRVAQAGQYDVMLYISDYNNTFLSDSFSYRVTPEFHITEPGVYVCTCQVAPDFFNVGSFYVGYIISDGRNSLYENMRCLNFEVTMFDNIKISDWSKHDKKFVLKPKLPWTLERTDN